MSFVDSDLIEGSIGSGTVAVYLTASSAPESRSPGGGISLHGVGEICEVHETFVTLRWVLAEICVVGAEKRLRGVVGELGRVGEGGCEWNCAINPKSETMRFAAATILAALVVSSD